MRYRDCPTIEVTERIDGDPAQIWDLVTDITLPVRFSPELRRVEWLDGSDRVEVGARFRGHSEHPAIGSWHTDCRVAEVDPGRRWVWEVSMDGRVAASWGFEIDPGSSGVTLRQWGRLGPAPSGLSIAIAAMPDKEGQIITYRLGEWERGIRANLAGIKALIEQS